MSAVEEIRSKLESRLSVLETEIESLRSALGALESGDLTVTAADGIAAPAVPASPNGSKPSTPRRGRTRRATTKLERSAELERVLAETGGHDAVELARQTGTDYGVVLERIRQLEQAGRPKS